jgi:hypothetical protein
MTCDLLHWRARLALATVRFVAFAAFDGLRALARAGAPFLFCTFDCFLRLAMIRPVLVGRPQRIDAGSTSLGNPTIELSTDRVVSAHLAVALGPNDHHLRSNSPSLHTPIAKWLTTTTKSDRI